MNHKDEMLRTIADIMNDLADELRALADSSPHTTIQNAHLDKVIIDEAAGMKTADVPLTEEPRSTFFMREGMDVAAVIRTLNRSFDVNQGPVRIVLKDGSSKVVYSREEVSNAFGG